MKLQKLIIFASIALLTSAGTFAQDLNVVLRSHFPYPGHTTANITGYVDSVGNEYALVGVSTGLSIVDVTNPASPVEVKAIPNIDNLWKEIKVYGTYAYVTTEGGGGLQIVNLRSLPDTSGIIFHNWTGDGAIAGTLNTIHALHIDGHFAYLYGSNLFNGGAIAVDLTDPWNPTYAGKYEVGAGSAAYVHDGYVRNDTMYAGHIYSGYFAMVDFTNKAAPVEIATQQTPNNFTHNTWLSTNSKILFTTDEVSDSYLTSYDVSNPANIIELDKIQSNPGSLSIVHNTHIIRVAGNDYAVTSWYKDGFTIVDAGRPANLVQVGNYDTYAGSGDGFEGTWGVYPYLPSGTIIVSNIEDGLYVFTPTYVRACYLEGMVTDSATGLPINGANIQILSTSVTDNSSVSGNYATGLPAPGGTYSVTYSKPGYVPKTVTGISLSAGAVTIKNVALASIPTFTFTGQVITAVTGVPVANANISISNNNFSYQTVTDASGNFSLPGMYADTYEIIAGHWGFMTNCSQNQPVSFGAAPMILELSPGYYDDFSFDFGWTVSGGATTGIWERGVPAGTINGTIPSNPGEDDSLDCSNKAYVTGNAGGAAASDDVDGGATILTSPVFDLSTYTNPYLNFTRWFYNGGGTGTPNDSLTIILNNGITNSVVHFARYNSTANSSWVYKSFQISGFITPTSTMKLIVRTADNPGGHLVEAGFDQFLITEGNLIGIEENENEKPLIAAAPNPFNSETTIEYNVKNKLNPDSKMVVRDITGRIIQSLAISQQKGTVTLSNLTSGIYFISIVNGTENCSPLKIVKTK
jgi:choice-of-anchor B domain-containing protein